MLAVTQAITQQMFAIMAWLAFAPTGNSTNDHARIHAGIHAGMGR